MLALSYISDTRGHRRSSRLGLVPTLANMLAARCLGGELTLASASAGDPGRDTRADNDDDDDDDKDTDGADDDAGGAEERSGDAVDAVARATKELERCGSFIDTPDEGEGDGKKKVARHAFAEHPITTARCRSGVPRALEHPARSSDVMQNTRLQQRAADPACPAAPM